MCEIAVVNPEEANIETIHQIAGTFHEEQGDGLGVLAVKDTGEKFEYDFYKSIHPHWATLYSFLKRNYDDAWRFVIHGRAATAGSPKYENAHPIVVDCDMCEFDYVIHNGSVRQHQNIRAGLTSHGHEFNTPVDSEVIAHKVGKMPETVEDHGYNTYSFRGNLNYLLFGEEGIFVHVKQKYHLTEDFVMTCSLHKFRDANAGFKNNNTIEWMLIRPGEDIETKDRTYSSATSSNRVNYWGGDTTGTPTSDTATDDVYTETYVDMSPYENCTAIQVAPGVIKLIDGYTEEETYVWRDYQPKLYYWYSDEDTPDNVDYLQQLADNVRGETTQCTLDGKEAEAAEEEARRAAEHVVKLESDEVDDEVQRLWDILSEEQKKELEAAQ